MSPLCNIVMQWFSVYQHMYYNNDVTLPFCTLVKNQPVIGPLMNIPLVMALKVHYTFQLVALLIEHIYFIHTGSCSTKFSLT